VVRQAREIENEQALRKGRLFRKVTLDPLRRNQDSAIASRQKPASVEALKAHCELTRAHAVSCGQNQARCGELVATGGVLYLRSAPLV
jgi:hypothetical protein